jgi:hypothetical protein
MHYLVNWVIPAQRCVSPKVIVKGFNKCQTSSAMDEMDDTSMLWNDSEDVVYVTSVWGRWRH